MDKTKVAVHLYGHLRTFVECAPYLKKHLLDLYECDVFVHTWDVTEHSTKSWYQDSIKCDPVEVKGDTLRLVEDLYRPRRLSIEKQGKILEVGFFGTHSVDQISRTGLHNLVYSMRRSIELRQEYSRENNHEYKYSVVIRPDIMLHEDLDIDRYKQEFEFYPKSSIHFVNNSDFYLKDNKYFNYPRAAEVFFFAQTDTINALVNLEKEFKRYYEDINIILPPQIENPEIAFFEFLHESGVLPRQYQFYYSIKRQNEINDIEFLPPSRSKSELFLKQNHAFTLSIRMNIRSLLKLPVLYIWKLCPKFVKKFSLFFLRSVNSLQRYLEYLNESR